MKKLIVICLFTINSFGVVMCETKEVDKCVKPKLKAKVIVRIREPQKQNQDQDQHQSQVVNVYPQSTQVKVVERSVYVSRPNNHLGLLAGFGKNCCTDKYYGVVGAGYERRIVGPLWLGVEAFTNRTYFGKIGLDF